MVNPSEQTIVDQCRLWVAKVIVGMNFCPFAKPVVESDAVSYSVINERSLEHCLQALSDELNRLYGDNSVETSLLIYPVGFEAFDDYLELAGIADELLIEEGFEGIFQLATFHPDYCFDGEVYDDAANYTNRSPYPILHILREASVEKALESVANSDKIPNRNIEFARAKGLVEMKALLADCKRT
ncbi:MAG TPA: DUF1415 domain-containing protein [Cycloclasticus sp.]|nr:DUF1415 domain-containing protein [Cycloclasticus sp.]HIL91319.1 DUF1415 domain-containing protein [Cycloclasticus sp.]